MKTVFGILDNGVVGSENQLHMVISDMEKQGIKEVIVADKCDAISHWWLLDTSSGKVMYFGTKETFSKFKHGR